MIAVIYIIAILLGLAGLAWMVLHIVQAARAQHALFKTIKEHETLDTLRQLAPDITGPEFDPVSVEKARGIIRAESKLLKPVLKAQIIEGLDQPSARGQRAFVVKIVSELERPF